MVHPYVDHRRRRRPQGISGRRAGLAAGHLHQGVGRHRRIAVPPPAPALVGLGRLAGDGLAVRLDGGHQYRPCFGGEAAGEAEGSLHVDPVPEVSAAVGPALTLVVVGGRGPDPGCGPLQLHEGLELGQLQQLRLRGGIGHRRRSHLDGLALGERTSPELGLRGRQRLHGLGRIQQVEGVADGGAGDLGHEMTGRAVPAREPGLGGRHLPGAQGLARRPQPLDAVEHREQLQRLGTTQGLGVERLEHLLHPRQDRTTDHTFDTVIPLRQHTAF